ncbi:AbiH family protein [Dysgonomonas sp. 520]|uniref:AbiH family protein n=1 Tax=Dysgonomonas sp. 520 TaxID=2302931 RepID=UPI0013CFB254|nr:AbiH family protein [Dysgonomonas sp. 520]NDW09420.1 hypothetical protein [Dysgonomonas sp. 520]
MNITFLLGNGFDLNIDMKTRYSHFYPYYLKMPCGDNTHIEKFKTDLKKDLNNWADLELEFGKYMKDMTSLKHLDDVYEDLCDSLSEYLAKEESALSIADLDVSNFPNDLVFPENHLVLADKQSLIEYKNKYANNNWRINIVTFNYTSTIEKLLYSENGDYPLPLRRGNNTSYKSILNKILHIHGLINDGMILGVNDASQIHNDVLKSDDDVLTTIVKPKRNQELKELIDKEAIDLIRQSQLIVLFGLSFGDTDKFWWELIGKYMLNSGTCRVILFHKGDDFPSNHKHKKVREVKKIKSYFLSQTNLSPEQKKQIEERIYIGCNTNIFKMKKRG